MSHTIEPLISMSSSHGSSSLVIGKLGQMDWLDNDQTIDYKGGRNDRYISSCFY